MKPIPAPLAAVIAAAAVLLLAAACGSSPSHTASGGSSAQGGASPSTGTSAASPLLAFSQCMRTRGVPDFPDPEPGASNAKFPGAQQLGVSGSVYQAAVGACQHLLPAGVDDLFPAAEVQQLLVGMRQFSQCMRAHGVPTWPDPSVDAEGRPYFDLSDHGFSRSEAHSPQLGAKETQCQNLLPSALGGLPEG